MVLPFILTNMSSNSSYNFNTGPSNKTVDHCVCGGGGGGGGGGGVCVCKWLVYMCVCECECVAGRAVKSNKCRVKHYWTHAK